MRLVIYRGSQEVGGNCVAIESRSTRLVIDVGMPLVDAIGNPFDAAVLRNKTAQRLVDDKVLPAVPGLFGHGPAPEGILLSHPHADHTGLVAYTRRDIPVWLSSGASDMMYLGLKFAGQRGIARNRQRKFAECQPFTIGEFTITAFPVDHSAFGSVAYLISAEGKHVLYSGDLRLHGRKPGMARQLLAALRGRRIDVLLMEGTQIGGSLSRPRTESELEDDLVDHIRSTSGIVLAGFSPLNLDRLVGFFRAAKRAGRAFVADPYAASVLHAAARYRSTLPDPAKDRSIRVYYPESFTRGCRQKSLAVLQDRFVPNKIEREELLSLSDRFVLIFRPSMLDADFGGNLPPRACCIYSYWRGYLDRQPQWSAVRRSAEASGGQFVVAHTSGHLSRADLEKFIRAVGPDMLVPIHTFEPHRFPELHGNVRLLADGEAMEVD